MLLDKLTMQAVLSLEAIVHLIGGLARDLQADFMPKFPQLCSRLADLISAGAEECLLAWQLHDACASPLCPQKCVICRPLDCQSMVSAACPLHSSDVSCGRSAHAARKASDLAHPFYPVCCMWALSACMPAPRV